MPRRVCFSSGTLWCTVLVAVSHSILPRFIAATAASWNWIPEDSHPCTIERMTHQELLDRFGPSGVPPLHPTPLVITADESLSSSSRSRNKAFQQMAQKDELIQFFGKEFQVTLSSSNALSERRRTIPLSQYLDEILSAQETTPDQLSNETWYLFGETYTAEWQELLKHYDMPPCYTCSRDTNAEWPVALSFGIGNRGSGVQWHTHGPGFSEAILGRKHWLLYPPGTRPPSAHKDQSSRQWMETVYPEVEPRPVECTLEPGEMVYFPDRWAHATINLDPYTVFVSSFTTEHGIEMRDEL